RRSQPPPNQSFPDCGLRFVSWLGVREKQDVAQLDWPLRLAARKLLFIEFHERCGNPFLCLGRKGNSTIAPIQGDELDEFFRLLDNASKGFRHRRAMTLVTAHLANQEQRDERLIPMLTSFHCERRNLLRRHFGNELSDLFGNCV